MRKESYVLWAVASSICVTMFTVGGIKWMLGVGVYLGIIAICKAIEETKP